MVALAAATSAFQIKSGGGTKQPGVFEDSEDLRPIRRARNLPQTSPCMWTSVVTMRLINLFTEDCVFDRPGALLNGRGELRAFMQRRPSRTVTRHTCTPPVLDQVTAQSADGITYLTFFEGEPSAGVRQPSKQIAVAEVP